MHSSMRLPVLFAVLTCFFGLIGGKTTAAQSPNQTQYTYSGDCNGMPHWVSMLYDREHNKISNVIVLAKCPEGGEPTFRIFREIAIPVNAGGMFGDRIKQAGIDYLIDGRIVSRKQATLNHRGPPKLLTCAGSEDLAVPMCSRFKLSAGKP
jgi:hypothetical protein